MNIQGVAYQVRASEAPGKSIVRGWPIKFVHQRPLVNQLSAGRPIKFVQQRPLLTQ